MFCPVTARDGRICFVLQQQGMGGYVLSCNSKGWEDMFCPVTARNYLVGFETRNISYMCRRRGEGGRISPFTRGLAFKNLK